MPCMSVCVSLLLHLHRLLKLCGAEGLSRIFRVEVDGIMLGQLLQALQQHWRQHAACNSSSTTAVLQARHSTTAAVPSTTPLQQQQQQLAGSGGHQHQQHEQEQEQELAEASQREQEPVVGGSSMQCHTQPCAGGQQSPASHEATEAVCVLQMLKSLTGKTAGPADAMHCRGNSCCSCVMSGKG